MSAGSKIPTIEESMKNAASAPERSWADSINQWVDLTSQIPLVGLGPSMFKGLRDAIVWEMQDGERVPVGVNQDELEGMTQEERRRLRRTSPALFHKFYRRKMVPTKNGGMEVLVVLRDASGTRSKPD
jgi:hypothetical protein